MNDTSNPNAISPKQRAIILDLARGKTVKEVARELGMSYQGVFQQLSHARTKANARTTYYLIYLVTCSAQNCLLETVSLENMETQHVKQPIRPDKKTAPRHSYP